MFKEMRDGIGKLPTLDSHVDNEYDTKTMIYNRKKEEKNGESSKILITLLGHN